MVSIAGDSNIVVEVQTEACSKCLRSISLAFIFERLWALAKVSIQDTLETNLPLLRNLRSAALSNSCYIRLQDAEEFVEVVKRVAIQATWERHSILWADTIVLEAVQWVVSATAL